MSDAVLELKIFMVLFVLLIALTSVSLFVFKPGIYSCNDYFPDDAKKADECRTSNLIGTTLLFPYFIPFLVGSFVLYSAASLIPAITELPIGIILILFTLVLTMLELWLASVLIALVMKRLNKITEKKPKMGTGYSHAKKYKNRS